MTAEQRRSRISARLHEAHQPISATALAKELGGRGVTVNAVAPGFVETDMTASLPDDVRAAYIDAIPLKRLGTPQDIADAVAFLASPGAGYITGQVIAVNGGMYC